MINIQSVNYIIEAKYVYSSKLNDLYSDSPNEKHSKDLKYMEQLANEFLTPGPSNNVLTAEGTYVITPTLNTILCYKVKVVDLTKTSVLFKNLDEASNIVIFLTHRMSLSTFHENYSVIETII